MPQMHVASVLTQSCKVHSTLYLPCSDSRDEELLWTPHAAGQRVCKLHRLAFACISNLKRLSHLPEVLLKYALPLVFSP